MTAVTAVESGAALPERRLLATRILFCAAFAAAVFASLGAGAVAIAPSQVLGMLADASGLPATGNWTAQQAGVLLTIRIPRTILAAVVGAALAVAGAVMQALFRNPLADPGLLGVSSGAALAAAAILTLSGEAVLSLAPGWTIVALPLAAFAGGLSAMGLVYAAAQHEGQTRVATLLLAGVAINALCGALMGVLLFVANDAQLRSVTFWMLGSLGGATWTSVLAAAPLVTFGLLWVPRLARDLNGLLLGETEAFHLGIDVERLKGLSVVLCAVTVGAAVSVTGLIGFVGLVVPHLVRLLVGPDHRSLLPNAALCGAALLLGADVVARTVVAPAELPIGIVTALVGAPALLWLLLRRPFARIA